jgi:hypothetical protein
MCNTRCASAVAALRQRGCLCAPSVTVCAVVCVRLMTGVPHAVLSAELWRFSTTTRVWERDDITETNGAGPSVRYYHVMTSVGLDLWVHGGQTETGEGDVVQHTWRCCCCRAEAESVTLCTFCDCVCCGVCNAHDWRAACRTLRRAVAVLHIHARLGTSRQHSGQRCWPQRKIRSRHDLRRVGPVGSWWTNGWTNGQFR